MSSSQRFWRCKACQCLSLEGGRVSLDWSQGAAIAGDVVEDVANGVVTANAVPSIKAGEGVVAPPVLGLPAEWANRISVPDCHAEPTPETGGEKESGKMGVGRVRKGSEPCTGARVAIEYEMGFPMDVDLIPRHKFAECAGFYHGG